MTSSATLFSSGLSTSGDGIAQTVPPAELPAVIAALHWALPHAAEVAVWIDAKHVLTGAEALQGGFFGWDHCENQDLWRQLESLLMILPAEAAISSMYTHMCCWSDVKAQRSSGFVVGTTELTQ